MAYPIYQGLWEAIDAVLFTKGMALAKDIAADLGVSPQELIDQMKKEERGKFTIIPEEEDTLYQCQALIHRGAAYMRCRCPTLGPTKMCSAHMSWIQPTVPVDLLSMQRLTTPDSTYLVDDSNTVFTLTGEKCGTRKGSKLVVFEIL